MNLLYCHPGVDAYLTIYCEKTSLQSPYGPLKFNEHSQKLIENIQEQFIQDLLTQGHKASFVSASGYRSGLEQYMKENPVKTISIMCSSEPSHQESIVKLSLRLAEKNIQVERLANTQFLITHEEFLQKRKKPPIMEYFYRRMRKQHKVLMDGDVPIGGKWNFDKENRSFDKKHILTTRLRFGSRLMPISRQEALDLLVYFIEHHLDNFGRLEDAMYTEDDRVYHSGLSMAINVGLLTPHEVIMHVMNADTAIANKEGYIRQILGWREYMYHRFLFYKDSIYGRNALEHVRELPSRFWRPNKSPLRMFCVNHVLQTVQGTGYSHHITRLMIIGNFCLLMGYNPHHVNKWFWEMYVDAFEWVVTPNVLGMSQYADGGNLATKPYISSANYINKMSNFCSSCYYDPQQKTGEKACPFNYLYRNFVSQHKELFARQAYVVANLQKQDIHAIQQQAQDFIESIGGG